jgi:hypothetical protein
MPHIDQSVRTLAHCWLAIDLPVYATRLSGLRNCLEDQHEVLATDDHECVVLDGVVCGVKMLERYAD